MRSIHYFPRYSQRENVVTNNTLLLFLRLMDFSKKRFEEFLAKLAGGAELQFAPAWLRIGQQMTTEASVVDGFIAQDSVRIVVETKLHSGFSADQLVRHLSAFKKNEDHKLFVLLCPTSPAMDTLDEFLKLASEQGVEVLPTSFEKIINVMRDVLSPHDDEMIELVKDFEDFCGATDLLPNDKYFLFTPPCGPSISDNKALKLYYCPADRGGRHARYLGVYASRQVHAIGKIAKTVTCEINLNTNKVTSLAGGQLTNSEAERVLGAARLAPSHGWDITTGHKFFLCDEWAETSYRKSTSHGIQGHRMLDLRNVFGSSVPQSAAEIAKGLNGRSWE